MAAIFCLTALITNSANAARILGMGNKSDELVISQNSEHPFVARDRLCFYRGDTEMACGSVVRVLRDRAVVRVDSRKDVVREKSRDVASESFVELTFEKARLNGKERIELVEKESMPDEEVADETVQGLENLHAANDGERPTRLLDGREDLMSEVREDDTRSSRRISNFSGGLNYLFPEIQYQRMANSHVAQGGMLLLMNSSVPNGSVKGLGAYATFTFYKQELFKGPWAQIGAGVFSLSANSGGVQQNYASPAVTFNVGWRWYWASNWNLGLGLGSQWLLYPKPETSGVEFSGVLPSVALDLGFAF